MTYEQILGMLTAATYVFMDMNRRQNVDEKIYVVRKNSKSNVHKMVVGALEEVEKTKRLSKYTHSRCNKIVTDLISELSGSLLQLNKEKTLSTEGMMDFLLSYESNVLSINKMVSDCYKVIKEEKENGV